MSERLLRAMDELNAALREVDPTAKVECVQVNWRKGRARFSGRLEQLLAWRLADSQHLRDVKRYMKALYG